MLQWICHLNPWYRIGTMFHLYKKDKWRRSAIWWLTCDGRRNPVLIRWATWQDSAFLFSLLHISVFVMSLIPLMTYICERSLGTYGYHNLFQAASWSVCALLKDVYDVLKESRWLLCYPACCVWAYHGLTSRSIRFWSKLSTNTIKIRYICFLICKLPGILLWPVVA